MMTCDAMDGPERGGQEKEMEIYKPHISEQLSHKANMAEQWVLAQEQEGEDCCISDPNKFFQIIRDFSETFEILAKLEKETDLEWCISLYALVELAQMVTTTLSELTQGRFTSCLILLRPAQELAQTVRYALREGALIEWYEYSIEKDIGDFKEIISIIERGVRGNWAPGGISPESAKEQIDHCNTRIQELEDLKLRLGNRRSDKGWPHLRKHWEPGSKELAREIEGTGLTTASTRHAHIQLDDAERLRSCPQQGIQPTRQNWTA